MGWDAQEIASILEYYDSFIEVLIASAKGKFKAYFSFFIRLCPIQNAIDYSFEILSFEQELRTSIVKKSLYPCLIFTMSFAAVLLFSNYVVPQLLNSFSEFDQPYLIVLLNFEKISASLFVIGLFILAIITFLLTSLDPLKRAFFQYAYRIPLCREKISYDMAGYLRLLHEHGLSSKESFRFLLELNEKSYIQRCASLLYEGLLQGKDSLLLIKQCPYLTKNFKTAYWMGTKANEYEDSLKAYQKTQKNKWLRSIQILSVALQTISYTYVALLVICVYQIMLVPLQYINEL